MRKLIDISGQTFNRLTVLCATKTAHGKPAWRCQCVCGASVVASGSKIRSGHTKSCGCFRADARHLYRGAKHHAWNGGKSTSRHGYIRVRVPNHPCQQNGYVQEHRLVMEKILGRMLRPDETVHHKNGVRADNRPENLELWAKAHSYGQRVSDLVAWAESLLQRYAPDTLNPMTTQSGSAKDPMAT